MRIVRTFACVLVAVTMVACDCFVPTGPTPFDSENPSTHDPSLPVPDPTVLSISVQGATSVRVGRTTPWQAVAQFSDGSQQTVTSTAAWTSSAPASASVDSAGIISGIAPGRATIQAAYHGRSGSGVVSIVTDEAETPTVVNLSVEGNTAIRVGESSPLQAIARLSDGSSQTVTALASWTSDGPAIASVASGTVVGLVAGQAAIRASYEGQTASTVMTVSASTPGSPTVVSLTIAGATSVQVGQGVQLEAIAHLSNGTTQTVTAAAAWTSSATNIAAVSGGLVSGLAAGTAPIQASYQGRVASTGMTVTSSSAPPPPPGPTVLSLSIQGTPTVQVGQTTQLRATAHLSDGSTQPVTALAAWTSGTPAVATIAAGLVTGQSAGTSTVSASHAGRSAQVVLTVTAAPPIAPDLIGIEVTAEVDLTQVLLNEPFRLRVLGVYSDGSKNDVTALAVITPDNVDIQHDSDGTLRLVMTLVEALLDPSHVVNVQYGGFTEAVNIVLKLPEIQALGLGTGGLTAIQIGSQLPAVQGVFDNGAQAALASDFPGLTWSLQPRGLLGGVLGLVGVDLDDLLEVSNGRVVDTGNSLLNQVLSLVGSALPVDVRASYDGVTSNVMQATVSR